MATIYRCDWCGLERKIRGGVFFQLKHIAPCSNEILQIFADDDICFECKHEISKMVESAARLISAFRTTKRQYLKAKKAKA